VQSAIVAAAVDSRNGSLWFATAKRLYQAQPNDSVARRAPLAHLGAVQDVAVVADTFAPTAEWRKPAAGTARATSQPELLVAYSDDGTGVAEDGLSLARDGNALEADCTQDAESRRFLCQPEPLDDGTYTLSARVSDAAGNVSERVTTTVTVDTQAPQVALDGGDARFIASDEATISGSVDEAVSQLTVAGEPRPLDGKRSFSRTISLDEGDGSYEFSVEATDAAGNSTQRSLTITRDTIAPSRVAADAVTIEANGDGTVTLTAQDGAVEANATVVVERERDGEVRTVRATDDGAFELTVSGGERAIYRIRLRDRAGNRSDETPVSA